MTLKLFHPATACERPYTGMGRRHKDTIHRLRALAWYYVVKSRGSWSDYKLNITFGSTEAIKVSDHAAMPKIFNSIRKHGRVPERGPNARRGFDLFDLVDNHPEFHGTKSIYDSLFWEILSDTSPTINTANQMVNKLFKLYGLTRAGLEYDERINDSFDFSNIDHVNILDYLHLPAIDRYDYWLSKALNNLPSDLDKLTLIGALYREAYLGSALKEAVVLKDRLLDHIDRFFRDGWAKPLRADLRPLTIVRMVYWMNVPNLELDGWHGRVDEMLQRYIILEDIR
jgi:hypothetical protein